MSFSLVKIELPNLWDNGMSIPISLEKKQEHLLFIKSNFGKISQREIARNLGLGRTTINRWCKEIGFKYKKHTTNEFFFDNFNENSLYILGLIYADGNIAWNPKKGYQTLTITSSAKDKDHLEKIRKILSSTKPLLFSPQTNSYRLIINNKNLVQRLMELGVTPRKSLILKFPQFISKEQLPAFLRGIIDGDGNVRYVSRKRSPYFEITIASGSKEFCKGLISSVFQAIEVKGGLRKVQNNTHIIQYSCARGEKLANFIYLNANILLKRKYIEYKKCLEEKNEFRQR